MGLDERIAGSTTSTVWLDGAVGWFDLITGKDLFDLLLPMVMMAAGAVAMVPATSRWAGRILLYLGTVPFCAYLSADLSKPHFGRLRPFEAAQQGGSDVWFTGASSFPSGHTAYYAGLTLPIVLLFPRLLPLLLLPVLVAVQRVLSGDHYFSDVTASIAIAALASLLLARLAGRDDGVRTDFPVRRGGAS